MSPPKRVWILEDDPGAQFVYQAILEPEYLLEFFLTIESFDYHRKMCLYQPQLIIADLRLPDRDFLEFLGSEDSLGVLNSPFIVVSSMDDIEILRSCYQEGALNYLTKPFKKNELLVTMERAFSLSKAKEDFLSGQFLLEPTKLQISQKTQDGGKKDFVQLTVKELQIFSLLEQANGNTVSRLTIQKEVWGDVKVGSKTLDVHLFHLRKKLSRLGIRICFVPPQGFALLRDGVN